jgi:hypothetical protein
MCNVLPMLWAGRERSSEYESFIAPEAARANLRVNANIRTIRLKEA